MQEAKPAIRVLGHMRDGVEDEGAWQQALESWSQSRLDGVGLARSERASERDVKAEGVHDVRIAPAKQVRLLLDAQATRAATGQVGVGQGRAEGVESLDSLGRDPADVALIVLRNESQERAEARQDQTVGAGRGQLPGQDTHSLVQFGLRPSRRQSERRLERRVEAVAARRLGEGGERPWQAGHVGLDLGLAARHVPAEPARPEPRERARRRHPVDRMAESA